MRPLQYVTLELSQMTSAMMVQSPEEHGVFCAIIWALFAHKGAVPDDDKMLAKIGRVSSKKFKIISPAIRSHFFSDGNGNLRHSGVDFQLQRAENISEERRKSGRKGNDLRWQNDRKEIATPSQEPRNAVANVSPMRIVNRIKKESRSPTGSARLRRAPTAGFSLLEEGVKVLGPRGRGIVRQILNTCDHDRVREMLSAAERKSPDDRIAYFLGGCNGELADPDQPTWKFEGPKEPLTDEMRDQILAKMREDEARERGDPPDETH